MARNKINSPNIQQPNFDYPNGRIRDNDGVNPGTPVNEFIYGDIHENLAKLMRRYDISFNNLPDNESNGYQLIDALRSLPSKNDKVLSISQSSGNLSVIAKLSKLEVNEAFIALSQVDSSGFDNLVGLLDGVSKPLIKENEFKPGDFVLLVNGSVNIIAATIYRAEIFESSKRDLVFNEGYFDIGDIGGQKINYNYLVGGDIQSAVGNLIFENISENINIVFANEMPNTNYKLRFEVESLGPTGELNPNITFNSFSFWNKSTTGCTISARTNGETNYRIHVSVIKLNS